MLLTQDRHGPTAAPYVVTGASGRIRTGGFKVLQTFALDHSATEAFITIDIKTRKPYTNMASAKWVEPIPSSCLSDRRAFAAATTGSSLIGIAVPIKFLYRLWCA